MAHGENAKETTPADSHQPLLRVRDLKKHFPTHTGVMSRVVGHVRAVDGVSFDLYEGECLGLVGESGSGKTTVGRAILRVLCTTASDTVFQVDGPETNLTTAPHPNRRQKRVALEGEVADPSNPPSGCAFHP